MLVSLPTFVLPPLVAACQSLGVVAGLVLVVAVVLAEAGRR